jgi:hypothetical protein
MALTVNGELHQLFRAPPDGPLKSPTRPSITMPIFGPLIGASQPSLPCCVSVLA